MIKGNSKGEYYYSVAEGIHYATGKPVSVESSGGIITAVTEISALPDESWETYIGPGLIDDQINGYAGIDFSGNTLTAEDVVIASAAIREGGVTSFLPTLISNSHDNMVRNLRVLDSACRTDMNFNDSVPGFHLEGPYLSSEEGFRGCHPVQYMRKPSWQEFSEFQEAAGGRIIQVTIAPEIEGATEFIKKCIGEGIIVAVGHTNASSEQIRNAVDNGATISTHLGNGCANLIDRHKNPIWPQLANDKLVPSIIADGNHLLPEEIKVFCKVKGFGNIMLISDVMYLAGMAPGRYSFMGADVLLRDDGMLINEKLNCLAGSSFPLLKGVGNVMNFTSCSLGDAIKMSSENVARVLNLNDRGTLKPGKRADLILFGKEENGIVIKKTFIRGREAYSKIA